MRSMAWPGSIVIAARRRISRACWKWRWHIICRVLSCWRSLGMWVGDGGRVVRQGRLIAASGIRSRNSSQDAVVKEFLKPGKLAGRRGVGPRRGL